MSYRMFISRPLPVGRFFGAVRLIGRVEAEVRPFSFGLDEALDAELVRRRGGGLTFGRRWADLELPARAFFLTVFVALRRLADGIASIIPAEGVLSRGSGVDKIKSPFKIPIVAPGLP